MIGAQDLGGVHRIYVLVQNRGFGAIIKLSIRLGFIEQVGGHLLQHICVEEVGQSRGQHS